MKKLLGVISATACVVSMGVAPSQAATPGGARSAITPTLAPPASSVAAAARRDRFSLKDRWARETARYGDSDSSVRSIEHVKELQYRLTWAGVYNSGAVGNFGPRTREGVRTYQRREKLRVTGVATHKTWAHLLRDTVRHRGRIPSICKTDGWHACYDRRMHQVTLWHGGRIHNTWLVRGGAKGRYETRVGNSYVYYRNIDHYSQLYDSPMPYAQFFDGGQAYHGSSYMMDPFVGHSHGCVNMYIEDARQLWKVTSNKYLKVTVYGAWD
ncbi:MAG: murein L,D-transpeptidase [Nocardioidaceae bacterium]|nr:murein L,D-transpeptidase [Nocardioidaceae bacterium]